MTALAFLCGLIGGSCCTVVMVAIGFMRQKREEAARPETPPTLRIERAWRMWRKQGRVHLELALLGRLGEGGWYANRTSVFAMDNEVGERLWRRYLTQCDDLAELSSGKVRVCLDEVEE